ncbi:hypothetical protein [Streptomyces griseoflavus]|uniref:hypothetical protein n=1 Tax=Streptomyces griseoflavus TaxID=35619 RepID=UPI00167E9374|nr:hypothetical protein [Streptomyces griseoflavus]GGV35117.1 hypothetical protein GCM10010293_38010 [Streptomyces griseoflavus]
MTAELVVSPSDRQVRASLADAPAWNAYAVDLRRFLDVVIEACGADRLEVSELLVSQPLPDRYRTLRNGMQAGPAEAMDLAERMAAGLGPYCRLVAPGRLRVESGWDGALHLTMDPAVARALNGRAGDNLSLDWRASEPDPEEEPGRVDDVVDDAFWGSVRAVADGLVLLCERWAHGAYGCRWFRVTAGNAAEVAQAVQPRSLLCVAANPDLRLDEGILEEDFTAFQAPLTPGRLTYRAYPGGADSLVDVTEGGMSFMLADAVLAGWCAVVPDPDGVIRAMWDRPDGA